MCIRDRIKRKALVATQGIDDLNNMEQITIKNPSSPLLGSRIDIFLKISKALSC